MTDKGNPTSDEEQKKAEQNLDDELRRISEKSNDLLRSLDSTGETIRDISQPSSVKANANSTSQVKNSLDGKPLSKKQITSEGIYRDTSEAKKSFPKIVLILFASIGVIAGLAIYQEAKTSAYLLAQANSLQGKKGRTPSESNLLSHNVLGLHPNSHHDLLAPPSSSPSS